MLGLGVGYGERRVGVLLVDADVPDPERWLAAAATAVAIVAVRRDAEAGAVAETAAWFVDELRFGSRRSAAELTAIGQRFGVALGTPQTPVAIGYRGPDRQMFHTALSWLERPVRSDRDRAWTLLGADEPDRIGLVQRRLQDFAGRGVVTVATGPAALGPDALRVAFARADFALRMLALLRARVVGDAPVVTSFGELGLAGLLSEVPRAGLDAHVRAYLGRILDRPELLSTLRSWYESGGSRLTVAAEVHIHRNSVGHRMERLRALLGVDPTDPAVALQVRAALTALDVLAVLDGPS
jgi:sugar diacid utilization regulator